MKDHNSDQAKAQFESVLVHDTSNSKANIQKVKVQFESALVQETSNLKANIWKQVSNLSALAHGTSNVKALWICIHQQRFRLNAPSENDTSNWKHQCEGSQW
jgi:hypothetical protein